MSLWVEQESHISLAQSWQKDKYVKYFTSLRSSCITTPLLILHAGKCHAWLNLYPHVLFCHMQLFYTSVHILWTNAHWLTKSIKRLIRYYWCLQTPISMYVKSQHHVNIMMIIAIHCDPLSRNCQFLKTFLVDHIGVVQTPIMHTIWQSCIIF